MYNHQLVSDPTILASVKAHLVKDHDGMLDSNEWHEGQRKMKWWLLPTFTVVQIDPTWFPTQEGWWEPELEKMADFSVPIYMVRYGLANGLGWNTILDHNFEPWYDISWSEEPSVGIEAGCSGPAFDAGYDKEDRDSQVEWIEQLLEDMSEPDSIIWI